MGRIGDFIIDMLRTGVPVTTSILGYAYAQKRSSNLWKTGGYVLAGYGVGYLASRLVLRFLDPPAGVLPQNVSMPPVAVSQQAQADVAGKTPATMPKMSGILNEPFQEVTGYARQAEQVSTPKLHVVPDQQPLPGVSDDALGRI